MMLRTVNLAEKLGLIRDQWNPRVVAQVNDTHVKLVKVQGEFVWHSHADEDELFLVLQGRLEIELPDGVVTLGPGELVVIPRGMEHRPVAREEVHLLLVESAGIRHTGEVVDERTVAEFEWI
jgi:mannose-6-phosphate isomerase-like protein (cupin superfamily)